MSVHPYLNFGRGAREAFTRYHEIFGGELVLLGMGDVPDGVVSPETADLVIHAALKWGDGNLLMASDTGAPDYGPMQWMYVNFIAPDVAEAERVFGELVDGGKIEMPMQATFFAPAFGVCVDRFGTPWMISTSPAEQPA